MSEGFKTAITFDDILLVPKYSTVQSRKDLTLKTRLTKKIWLNNPIVSSNMDTVTETQMAISMARNGGIGIVHRFLSVDEQCEMVRKVKRAESLRVDTPYTCSLETTLEQLNEQMTEQGVHSILVTSPDNKLLGIVTTRDTRFVTKGALVKSFMTPRDKLVVCDVSTTTEQAKEILDKKRIEKLPIVDKDNNLCGLYTSKDILNWMHRPYASLDSKGRLLVGAAIGVKNFMDRARRLIEAEVDLLVVDIAHGHSSLAIDATKLLKKTWPDLQVVAGNVCTEEGARDLC
jgi:IMP dehydrogenase